MSSYFIQRDPVMAYRWETIQGSYLNCHSDICFDTQTTWWTHFPWKKFTVTPQPFCKVSLTKLTQSLVRINETCTEESK